MRRGDERGALRADKPTHHGAPGLHELGREHDIDIARRRHQGENWRPAAIGHHLDIIDGGAGALRHARHRGRLRVPAIFLGEMHDPVRHHAATLPADRQDRELDDLALARQLHVHGADPILAKPSDLRSRRFCSQEITPLRIRARNRSARFGLLMTSAR